jgi:chromosome segregation protein
LVLRGFKSFASTTTLRFEPGVTCVVGPNGSGKSNVVDALSWVMGEQGPKTLRGGKMEDVIFAGTSKRAPLGRAEVVLTIDNSDGALPIEYSEVTISRTMFRSGGSEYAINGTPSRLLDIQELLSDSGIGREMHVIVGQGQLDTILNATPETRRGLIEEAAGILKHRKRKERAQRKLDATAANLNRLQDLIGELRRQLKPLGRQAEVARKAQSVQIQARDAQARIWADDYQQAQAQLESDAAAEAAINARREELEQALTQAREAEEAAEAALAQTVPALTKAQETWFAFAGLKERAQATGSIAAERARHIADALSAERPGRDPEAIEREAERARQAVAKLEAELAERAAALEAATAKRTAAEAEAAQADAEYAAQQRAAADRREGLARLDGEVHLMRSKAQAAADEIERYTELAAAEAAKEAEARHEYGLLETELASWSATEPALDAAFEQAAAAAEAAEKTLAEVKDAHTAAAAARGGLAARLEALQLGLSQGGAEEALLATAGKLDGLLGAAAALITVPKGYEAALATALGAAADAVAVLGLGSAVASFEHLRKEDLGRAGLLLADAEVRVDRKSWPKLPEGEYALDIVKADERLLPALGRALFKVAVVANDSQALALVKKLPEVTAVTKAGDLFSTWFAVGGSQTGPSLIELQSAVKETEAQLAEKQAEVEQLRFAQAEAENALAQAQEAEAAALARLNESDATHSALADQASGLKQRIHSASELAVKYRQQAAQTEAARKASLESLAALEERLQRASVEPDEQVLDPVEKERLADLAAVARQDEMQARLAHSTINERVRAMAGQAETLARSAQAERDRLVADEQRRERLAAEAVVAAGVQQAVKWLAGQLETALAQADAVKQQAAEARTQADEQLRQARGGGRDLAKQYEVLMDSAHKDRIAKAEQQMVLDAIAAKALEELGLDAETLVGDYGPEVPVPPLAEDEEPRPYDRAEQEKLLRNAKRDLAVLGKVNPLALEEFEAMQERHAYLAEQLEDLRKTRADLLEIIDEVDERMREVFETAYADVAREFATSFARLFPGGEGKLFLTEPDNWLTTGVEVEAKPAGKKVKRLSLLSGGERSLTAIAFLVSLFKARPSPFYILDEVEAALDDTNLERLLQIYEELRADSQLLIITHQKRTMEVADALYGITMGADGVSTVISQRLRDK